VISSAGSSRESATATAVDLSRVQVSDAWLLEGALSNLVLSFRSWTLKTAAALAAGAVLGSIPRLLEADTSAVGRAVYLVLNEAWPWSALAFCVGLVCASRTASAALAAVSLAAAVAAYYVVQSQTTWAGSLSASLPWAAVALMVGPIGGLAGNLARMSGLRGLPFRLMIPVLAVVETSGRLQGEVSVEGHVGETAWTVTRFAAVAVSLTLAVHSVLVDRRSRPARPFLRRGRASGGRPSGCRGPASKRS
jgi:hypothetical protein